MASVQGRPIPRPTPETEQFWNGLAEGRIVLQRCAGCGQVRFPPRGFCPHCGGEKYEAVVAAGDAVLHSYVVSHHRVPGFERPNIVAIAELAEGPRLMTQIEEAAPGLLRVGARLEPVFRKLEEGPTLLHFRLKEEERD